MNERAIVMVFENCGETIGYVLALFSMFVIVLHLLGAAKEIQ